MGKVSISVKPYRSTSRPDAKWVLNVWHPTGRRERRFFPSKDRAEAQAQIKQVELENLGKRALGIDDKLRVEALEGRERLAPFGVSITDVINEYVRRRGASTVTVSEVAAQFLASRLKLQRSTKHLTGLRCLFKRFSAAMGEFRIVDVTSEHVEVWLHALAVGPVTINSYRALLYSLFEFATKKKWCVENPIKAVERMTPKRDEVGVLTSDHLGKLLALSSGDVRATIAIGAFAGIRPEETARLTWQDVDLARGIITVNALKSKTGRHRYVKVLPCLAAWISPLIASGSIQGPNFRRRYDEVRRRAGFAVRGNQEKLNAAEQDAPIWPHDALRHSFASYHLAKYRDAASLALELGHESTRLIFRHYRRRVSQQEAEAYFAVMP